MMNPTDDQTSQEPSLDNEQNLDWAKQAYERLKKQQEDEKKKIESLNEELKVEESVIDNTDISNKLDESYSNQSLTAVNNVEIDIPKEEDSSAPELGEFDDTFTWSAKVLEAQGKSVENISLDEVNWLSKLQQGLEKLVKGL